MFHPEGPSFFELAKQALSSTKDGYDLLAPKFDYTPFRTPASLLSRLPAELGDPNSVTSALDVCCGTGAGMQMLRSLVSDRLVGIDMSPGMLEIAKEKTAAISGDAELEFILGDALDMPFEDEFDLAVCFGAHGHILPRDEPQFVKEIHKALKPGGRFAFISGYKPQVWRPTWWLARGFNGAMRVRNLILRPPFIMYYLTFVLPAVQTLLEEHGFDVEVRDIFNSRMAKLIIATKRSE